MTTSTGLIVKQAELPLPVVHTINGCDTVEEAVSTVELDYPEIKVERDLIRQLLISKRVEEEKDEATLNPSSVDLLLGTIDRGLNKEITRITRRVAVLSKIAEEAPHHQFTIDETDETLTPEDAREELIVHRATLLELKKALVDQKKAEAAANQGAGVSVNVDLGNVMRGALANIKAMELPAEARVVESK